VPVLLTADQLRRDLALRDLSDPTEGPHAIQQLVEAGVAALAAIWEVEVRWCRGPRIVPVEDNYDHLLIGPAAASRDARYTRYVDDRHMLRSHSSAMVPAALRDLAEGPAAIDDVLLVCPGIVYRRDAIDWQHSATPQQLDLWRVSRRLLGESDLAAMIATLARVLAPGRRVRAETRVHPYTLAGREVDVEADGRFVEVWECGLAHPEVLARCGLAGWSGLALGMGLDRLLMLSKGVPDIRLLRSVDPRVAQQMLDLAPYAPVSSMPPIRRDLSIAVDGDDDAEELGDQVREALGADAAAVEEVSVVAQTAYEQVPAAARARLGMRCGQRNLLVRLVLRDLGRTLTDAEANRLRDRVFAALHRGTVHNWAAGVGEGVETRGA
jgi:phenylalanyl-tRNA synthetase alpha chain